MKFSTLFIDLDDTLYSHGNGIWKAVRVRIDKYMHEVMGMREDEIPALRAEYFQNYGTTLRGLQTHHDVDALDYMEYVHDIPLGDYLNPDPALRATLDSLPQKLYIFTNANAGHAKRVMEALGVRACFEGVIDVVAMEYYCKPNPEAFRRAMKIAGESDPERCLLADDLLQTLKKARQMGFYTVLVGDSPSNNTAHAHITNIKELPQVIERMGKQAE